MIPILSSFLRQSATNFKGQKLSQKIVVFESDDWGSIRTPKTSIDSLLNQYNIDKTKNPYLLYDHPASAGDVSALFAVLKSHRDSLGNAPTITANVNVANPDFDFIKQSGFKQYRAESIVQTFRRIFDEFQNPISVWKQGMAEGLFYPQFHGREHLWVNAWLETLQHQEPLFLEAFELGFWGITPEVYPSIRVNFQAAFDGSIHKQSQFVGQSIKEGIDMFDSIFGFKPKTFIPTNYIWSDAYNSYLKENGILGIQGMKYQLLPKEKTTDARAKSRRWNGQLRDGLVQTVRNAAFEPAFYTKTQRKNEVEKCLNQINNAFLWHQPAIISTHRLNFSGQLDLEHRDINLSLLNDLLRQMLKKWPNILFLNSEQITDLYLTKSA